MEKIDKDVAIKKDSKTTKKQAEKSVKNVIDINPQLVEAPRKPLSKKITFTFGRMNPFTSGHFHLAKKIEEYGPNQPQRIYLSHTQNSKKDPLSYNDKIKYAKEALRHYDTIEVRKSKAKTLIEVLKEVEAEGFTDITVVVGADRVNEFKTLLNKYNGADYNFNSIVIKSAGQRDPDAEGVEGISASKVRKLAVDGNFEEFKKVMPVTLPPSMLKDMYDKIRKGLNVKESNNVWTEIETECDAELEAEGLLSEAVLTQQQRRKRALIMRKYKTKIAQARKRALRRAATTDKLKLRARKKAINIIRQKVAGKQGLNYAELSPGEKMIIDKKVEKRKAAIDRIAKRLVPQVRKADLLRLSGRKMNEEFEALFEQLDEARVDKHEMGGYLVIDGYVFKDSGKQGRSTYGRYTIKDPNYVKDPKEVGMHRNYRKPDFLSFSTMAELKKWLKTQPKKSAADIEAIHKKYADREAMYNESADELDEISADLAKSVYNKRKMHSDNWKITPTQKRRLKMGIDDGHPFRNVVIAQRAAKKRIANEEVEEAISERKRFHQMFNKEGKIKLDGRFKAFKVKKEGALVDRVTDSHKDERDALAKKQRQERADARVREIRMGLAKANEETKYVDFESEEEVIQFIDNIAEELFQSISLAEQKTQDALMAKAEKSGEPLDILEEVYNRGVTSWEEGSSVTPEQKGFMRVDAYIAKNESYYTIDADLREGVNDPGIFKAVFLAGGPGSGKSFIVGKTALTTFGLKLINSDNAFEAALKKAGLKTTPEDIYSDKGQEVRVRAKQVTGKMQQLAIDGRLGLVIDGTGKDFAKIKAQGDELRVLGYEIAMVFVNTDLDTAQKRNAARSRSLPEKEVEAMWKDVQNNIGKFQNYFGTGSMYIVDNSEGANWEGAVNGVYNRIGKWVKADVRTPLAKKWIAAAKAKRGIKEDVMPGYISNSIKKVVFAKKYKQAAQALKALLARKEKETDGKPKHSPAYYASEIIRTTGSYGQLDARTLANMVAEEGGAGDEGTEKVTKRYKKDTPYQSVNEEFEALMEDKGSAKHHLGIGSSFKHILKHAKMHVDTDMDGDVDADDFKKSVPNEITGAEKKNLTKAAFAKYAREKQHTKKGVAFEEVSQKEINDLEIFADRLLSKFNIDIEFTRHFADRVNDSRNDPEIKISELQQFFKKIAAEKGKNIKQNADAEVVLKDIQKDLNLPVVINYKKDRDEFEVVNKTIMRKKKFATSNKTIEYK